MPREWRFTGPFAAWRSRCAGRNAASLADAASALVDRATIDWSSLLAKVRVEEGDALGNLRLVERLRGAATLESGPLARRSVAAARALTTLAAIQITICVSAAGVSWLGGDAAIGRAPLLVTLAFTAAALLLAAAGRRDQRTSFLVAAYLLTADAFARPAADGRIEEWLDPLVTGVYPEAFVPACHWQFALQFPRTRRFTRFDAAARRMAALSWTVGALLFLANLPVVRESLAGPLVAPLARNSPSNLFWTIFALLACPAIAAIFVRSRRAEPADRRRVARFGRAIALGTAPLLILGLARVLVPPLDLWLREAGPDAWINRAILGSMMCAPILGSIALSRDRPFDVPVAFRPPHRQMLRLIVWSAWLIPTIALIVTAYRMRRIPLGDLLTTNHTWRLVALAALALLLVMLRSRALRALGSGADRAASRNLQLLRALDRVRAARGRRELDEVLRKEIRVALNASAVAILVERNGSLGDPSLELGGIDPNAALVAMLREAGGPLAVPAGGSLHALLPVTDREWVDAHDVDLLIPIVTRGGALAAVVAVRLRRLSRVADDDLVWLAQLAATASVAWEASTATGPTAGDAEPAFECRRCGRVADTSPVPCGCHDDVLAAVPATLAGKFDVIRRLGSGGMGIVYLARDRTLGRDVAIKTLPALRGTAAATLRREARAMAALEHDGLAAIHELQTWRGTPMLIVEYLPGGTLADRLTHGPMTMADAVRLGARLARALAYMHERGVVHGDVKPANIGLTESGTPKLLDFGLVISGGSAAHAGTRAYMPPEAFSGSPADPAFDLWALAVVIREAIACQDPNDAARRRHGAQHESPALRRFFERALAVRPERRFASATSFAAALESLPLRN
jgi:hypothetical protein